MSNTPIEQIDRAKADDGHWCFVNNIQDLTLYGRQEVWEDSPEGWPQRPTDR